MCQPFAMSACRVSGTVRPDTISRGALPPITFHFTGRSETAASVGTGERAGGLWLVAKSGSRSRYASLFIRPQIYMADDAFPFTGIPARPEFGLCFAPEELTNPRDHLATPDREEHRVPHIPRRQGKGLGGMDGPSVIH